MQSAVAPLAGVLTGFLAGWALLAAPVAARFGPTTVVWDATGCPPGGYDITATATNLSDGTVFRTTTSNMRLPRETVSQQFANLPPGEYAVSATSVGRHGRTLQSETQIVSGLGTWALLPDRGHQRQASIAQPPAPSAPVGAAAARAGASVVAAEMPLAEAPVAPGSDAGPGLTTTEELDAGVGPPPLPLTLDRQLAQLLGASDREETGLDWRSLVTIDLDDDGVVDLAAIELASGEVWLVWLPH